MISLFNGFRFITFLIILIAAILLIDTGFFIFMSWSFSKAFSIFDWEWYWLILIGLFALIGLRILLGVFNGLASVIISLITYISPFATINFYTIIAVSLINTIALIWSSWSQDGGYSILFIVIRIIYTFCCIQLCYAFASGANATFRIQLAKQLDKEL